MVAIRRQPKATVVSETPQRVVIEASERTVGDLLRYLPGWDAEPVTKVTVPSPLPELRAPSAG